MNSEINISDINYNDIFKNITDINDIDSLRQIIVKMGEDMGNLHSNNLILNTKLDIYVFNINSINTKDELIERKYSLSKLKLICKDNKLNTFGNKDVLIDRVWGLKDPTSLKDDAFVKKRGRKTLHDREKEITLVNNYGPRCLSMEKIKDMIEIFIGMYDYRIYNAFIKNTIKYYKSTDNKIYTIREDILYHIGLIKGTVFIIV